MTTKMQNIIIVYIRIVLAVCVDVINIPKVVLSTLVGVNPQLHVKDVTDSSMAKIVTKLICFSLNRKKRPWKNKMPEQVEMENGIIILPKETFKSVCEMYCKC